MSRQVEVTPAAAEKLSNVNQASLKCQRGVSKRHVHTHGSI
jgi:hypothetical protein